MQNTQRHRHFVALPLMAVALLAVSTLDRLFPANVLAEKSDDTRSAFHGFVLKRSESFFTIDAGFGLTAETVAGTLYAVADTSSATVAAVEGSVIAHAKGRMWVLPSGYQLRLDASGVSKRTPISPTWLQEKLQESRSHAGSSTPLSVSANSKWLFDRLSRDAAEDLPFAVPAIASSILRPLPEELVAAWVQSVKKGAMQDPHATVATFIDVVTGLPERYEAAGYPKQAIVWRSALRDVRQFLSPLLTATERATFEDVLLSRRTEEQQPAPKQSVAEQTRTYSDDTLKVVTMHMLMENGVLFSSATSITPDPVRPDCARIDGIFIADHGRDSAYAFSYCPATLMLTGITKDSQPMPNDVTVTQFFTH